MTPLTRLAHLTGMVAMLLLAGPSAAEAPAVAASASAGASVAPDPATTQAAAAPMSPEAFEQAATAALWWGDAAEVLRLHAMARDSRARVKNGETLLSLFHEALDVVFDNDPVSEDYHRQLVALTAQWAREHPASPLAHQLHLRARTAYAWWHRGTGYANTVSPDAMRRFNAEIGGAIEYLTRHGGVVLQDGAGHRVALILARAAGWDLERQAAILEAGLRLAPDDEDLHQTMLNSLLPKWGGSAERVDRYIRWAAEQVGPAAGDMLYARLYARAGWAQFSHALFTDSLAQWARMKNGWQRVVQQFPTAHNINRYAYLACIARDKPTLKELLERVGDRPVLRAWDNNPARTLEGCRRFAQEPDEPQTAPPTEPKPAVPASAAPTA